MKKCALCLTALPKYREKNRMTTTLAHSLEVQIPIGEVTLEGTLQIPEAAQGLVVFAHGLQPTREPWTAAAPGLCARLLLRRFIAVGRSGA